MNLRGVTFIFKIVLFAIACISSVCETLDITSVYSLRLLFLVFYVMHGSF